jgi:PAS domain S-box-containing protein
MVSATMPAAGYAEANAPVPLDSAVIELLGDITLMTNKARSAAAAFRFALDRIIAYIGWPAGHVYLVEADNTLSLSEMGFLAGLEPLGQPRKVPTAKPRLEEERVLGRIVTTGQALWVRELPADDLFLYSHLEREIRLASGFAFPILVGSEVVAIMAFFSQTVVEPDELLLKMMAQIGVQLGRVVERERAAKARWLFHSSLDALVTYVAVLDETGMIIAANAAWRYSAEIMPLPWPVMGTTGSNYLAACEQAGQDGFSDAIVLAQGIRSVVADQQVVFYWEYPCHIAQEERWFVVRVTRFGGDEEPARLVVAHDDVTTLKRAEAAKRKSDRQFRAIYEGAGLGIAVMNAEGHVLQSNPAWHTKLGYSQSALQELRFQDLIHPLDQAGHQQRYQALLAGKVKKYNVELRCYRGDGRMIWLQMTISSLPDEGGELSHALAIIQDVTAQKQVAAELTEVQHRLSDSREKERLRLAQELHDGPAQDLIGADLQLKLLSNLLKKEADQEKVEMVRQVLQQVNGKLREICGQLRPPTLAPFGLEVAIRSHLEQFQEQHPEIKVQHRLGRDGQLLPEPMRLALFRMYQEMLSNVVKHAQAHHVLVRFALDVEQVTLEVQDDGVGFAVPERWIQLARQGHLGLVGISERAEEIGGQLVILSKPGRGSIVRVVAPSPLGN